VTISGIDVDVINMPIQMLHRCPVWLTNYCFLPSLISFSLSIGTSDVLGWASSPKPSQANSGPGAKSKSPKQPIQNNPSETTHLKQLYQDEVFPSLCPQKTNQQFDRQADQDHNKFRSD